MRPLAPLGLLATLACAPARPLLRHDNPPGLAQPRGYSHVVEARGGRTLYVSGQIALDARGALVGADDARAQARQVFENLKAALAASGARMEDVVKLTIFLTDLNDLQAFREVRDTYFPTHPPASSLVQVKGLVRPDLRMEVEAVAVVPDAGR